MLIVICMIARTEVVETRKGLVQGRSITLLGGEFRLDPVDVFLGIPYALPPVGPRRWAVTSPALSAVRGADFKLVYHQIKDRWEFSDRIVSNPQALKIVLC